MSFDYTIKEYKRVVGMGLSSIAISIPSSIKNMLKIRKGDFIEMVLQKDGNILLKHYIDDDEKEKRFKEINIPKNY